MWFFVTKKKFDKRVRDVFDKDFLEYTVKKAINEYFQEWRLERREERERWSEAEQRERWIRSYTEEAFTGVMRAFMKDLPRDFLDNVVERINGLQLKKD